jgi:hypothetical protein
MLPLVIFCLLIQLPAIRPGGDLDTSLEEFTSLSNKRKKSENLSENDCMDQRQSLLFIENSQNNCGKLACTHNFPKGHMMLD